jgi:hypothetical protein
MPGHAAEPLATPGEQQNSPSAHPQPATKSEPIPLSDKDLGAIAAGDAIDVLVMTTQSLKAVTSQNSIQANEVRSGDINISDNALAGFSGIGNFVINSGNQNTLQGSLSVTVITPVVP